MVCLPKQADFDDKLGLSKAAALRRFSLLERRLERDPNVKAAYHDFMREYLELGHMSRIKNPSDDERATLLQLANDEGASCPNAAAALKTNFYVDDFIGGADSIGNARQLRIELSQLLAIKAASSCESGHPISSRCSPV
uniref:Uncharacterized protein n=1 Tax=Anopheles arabiensis TaxID=7173 RepID=A0A182HGJ1_ANOAR